MNGNFVFGADVPYIIQHAIRKKKRKNLFIRNRYKRMNACKFEKYFLKFHFNDYEALFFFWK